MASQHSSRQNRKRSEPKRKEKGLPSFYRSDGSLLPVEEAQSRAQELFAALEKLKYPTQGAWGKSTGGSSAANRLANLTRKLRRRPGRALNFLTAPPEGVAEASDSQIKKVAKRIGLDPFSSDLVRCFDNIIAGGRFVPPSIWRAEAHRRKLDAHTTEAHMSGLMRVIKSIDYSKVPGKTSLEKSVAVLKLLGHVDRSAGVDDGSYDGVSFFSRPTEVDSAIEKVNRTLQTIGSLDDVERMAMVPANGSASLVHYDELSETVEIAESLLSSSGLQAMLKVARALDSVPTLGMSGVRSVKPNRHGVETQHRMMRDLNELPLIAKSNWALFFEQSALFWSKVLNREPMVREHIAPETQKQLLYLLIDSSGSMSHYNRASLALAVLVNRLKGVVKGEAELQYRMFDADVFPEFEAKAPEDAQSTLLRLKKNNFSGGDTRISHAIGRAVESILKRQEQTGGVRPEIAIVTDGIDHGFNTTLADLKGVRLHAFSVGERNPELSKLAKASGGVALLLSDQGELTRD